MLERWTTPISDSQSAKLDLIKYDGLSLTVIISCDLENKHHCFKFFFNEIALLRCTKEDYRRTFWSTNNSNGNITSITLFVSNSDWIESVNNEPLLRIFNPTLRHFLIITGSDDIEILANDLPDITEIYPDNEVKVE